jgi:hypothetical protein
MFEIFLISDAARRATLVLERLLSRGLSCALTGSLAIEAQLRAHGLGFGRCELNDIDLVVADIKSLSESVAEGFLLSHVHPLAPEGKLLVQLIDPDQRLRVDVFRAYGKSLSRSQRLDSETGDLNVLALEDLRARSTAQICTPLENGRPTDIKFESAFCRLCGHGQEMLLTEAWNDHRQSIAGTVADASKRAFTLLSERPHLLAQEEYSSRCTSCEKCLEYASLKLATPEETIALLGYW